ncbi:MAG: DUF4129 domain-containing protein, partial [Candidatus Kariarchaeaceae archaeon]
NNTGVEQDIIILVTLDEAQSSSTHNIRNVTIFYRFSDDDHIDLVDDAVFTDQFTPEVMEYEGLIGFTYNFTLPFQEHGVWVEYYVIVYDYAGHGLDAAGVTFSATNPYGGTDLPPGYDTDFARTDSKFLGNPHKDKMGDTFVNELDPLDDFVFIESESKPWESVKTVGNFTQGENLTIYLDLVPDVSGVYTNVSINWRIRTYDLDTASFLPFSDWTYGNMSFVNTILRNSVTYQRYEYLITADQLDWFTQLDYYFNVTDSADNSIGTETILIQSSTSGSQIETWVEDEIDPSETSSPDFGEYPKDERDNTGDVFEVWNNETASVTQNVTDYEIGIDSVVITYYCYDEQGANTTSTLELVENGIEISSGNSIAPGENYNTTIPFDFAGLANGSSVSYEITVMDKAGNTEIINDQNLPNAKAFNVFIAPEPEEDITEVESTVTEDITSTFVINGTTYTSTYTSGQVIGEVSEEDSSNALIIVLGFIGGLTVLILYYQRHNIGEIIARRRRRTRVQGTLQELTGEIQRLGAEGKYKRAILLTWEALERVAREIIQAPRRYNQTAREFAAYLSTITIVDRETLITLSASYEAAKYGKENPTHDDWDDAVKALDITVRTIIESGARVQFEEDDDEF